MSRGFLKGSSLTGWAFGVKVSGDDVWKTVEDAWSGGNTNSPRKLTEAGTELRAYL